MRSMIQCIYLHEINHSHHYHLCWLHHHHHHHSVHDLWFGVPMIWKPPTFFDWTLTSLLACVHLFFWYHGITLMHSREMTERDLLDKQSVPFCMTRTLDPIQLYTSLCQGEGLVLCGVMVTCSSGLAITWCHGLVVLLLWVFLLSYSHGLCSISLVIMFLLSYRVCSLILLVLLLSYSCGLVSHDRVVSGLSIVVLSSCSWHWDLILVVVSSSPWYFYCGIVFLSIVFLLWSCLPLHGLSIMVLSCSSGKYVGEKGEPVCVWHAVHPFLHDKQSLCLSLSLSVSVSVSVSLFFSLRL